MIKLSRGGKKLEGISTLDLVTLQRHISGVEPITAPYKLYAADLDGNGHIGANDLSLLKKALLGGFKLPSFKGNLSWVFFGDPCSPGAPEDLLQNLCHAGVEIDHNGTFPTSASFKALKMGDVNGDMVNMAWNLTPRTSSALPLFVKENAVDHSYEVIASEDAPIYGFQMSLNGLGINIKEGVLAIDQANMAEDKDGFTNISWGQSSPTEVKAGDVLFTIENLPFEMSLEDLLANNEDALYAEIYTEGLENQKIEFLPYHENIAANTFESKLSPNPFTDVTKLQVIIPAGEEFVVSFYDMKGIELFNRKYVSYTNEAEIVINSEIIQVPGVYYYRVTSGLGELSGKFVRQ